MRGLLPTTERRVWWWVFGLVVVAGAAWAVAVPPMTGVERTDHRLTPYAHYAVRARKP